MPNANPNSQEPADAGSRDSADRLLDELKWWSDNDRLRPKSGDPAPRRRDLSPLELEDEDDASDFRIDLDD